MGPPCCVKVTKYLTRDSSVRLTWKVVSEAAYVNRHRVNIHWTKAQDISEPPKDSDVGIQLNGNDTTFTMIGVATPSSTQSEAFIATAALHHICGGNARDEKVSFKLPSVWKELWSELAGKRKQVFDAQDRITAQALRALIRRRCDRELEDGVILQDAFRGRGAAKKVGAPAEAKLDDRMSGKTDQTGALQSMWAEKTQSKKYRLMLVCLHHFPLPVIGKLTRNIAIAHAIANVVFQNARP